MYECNVIALHCIAFCVAFALRCVAFYYGEYFLSNLQFTYYYFQQLLIINCFFLFIPFLKAIKGTNLGTKSLERKLDLNPIPNPFGQRGSSELLKAMIMMMVMSVVVFSYSLLCSHCHILHYPLVVVKRGGDTVCIFLIN